MNYFTWKWSQFEGKRWCAWHSVSAGRPSVIGYCGVRLRLWTNESTSTTTSTVGPSLDVDLVWVHFSFGLIYKLKP